MAYSTVYFSLQNISNHKKGNPTDAIFGEEICFSKQQIQNNTTIYHISEKAFKLVKTGFFFFKIDL